MMFSKEQRSKRKEETLVNMYIFSVVRCISSRPGEMPRVLRAHPSTCIHLSEARAAVVAEGEKVHIWGQLACMSGWTQEPQIL